jgi:Holliday junction resolvase-like predicted endonuclease
MAGTNYKRGRQAEYLAITHLKKEGYFWTQRAYGSKGKFDVYAMGTKGGILVQVKTTKRQKIVPSMYDKEMEELQKWVDTLEELPEFVRIEWWVQRQGIRGWTKWRFRPNQKPEQIEGNLEGGN